MGKFVHKAGQELVRVLTDDLVGVVEFYKRKTQCEKLEILLTVWKIRKFTLIEKILREVFGNFFSKNVFFCQKSVRLNFRNIHLTCKNCEKLISRKI